MVGTLVTGVSHLVLPSCRVKIHQYISQLYEHGHYIANRVLEASLMITSSKVPVSDSQLVCPYFFAEEGYLDIDGIRYAVRYEQQTSRIGADLVRVVFLVSWIFQGREARVVISYSLSSKGLAMTMSEVETLGDGPKHVGQAVARPCVQKPILSERFVVKRTPRHKVKPQYVIKPRFYCSSVDPLVRVCPYDDIVEPLEERTFPTVEQVRVTCQRFVRKGKDLPGVIKFIFYKKRAAVFLDIYYTDSNCDHQNCECSLHVMGSHKIMKGFVYDLDLPFYESSVRQLVFAVVRHLVKVDNLYNDLKNMAGFIAFYSKFTRPGPGAPGPDLQSVVSIKNYVRHDRGLPAGTRRLVAITSLRFSPGREEVC